MAAVASTGVKDLFQRLEEQNRTAALTGEHAATNEPNKETEIIVVGAKGSGKSSLILGLINKDEVPKPTTALEYKFARRTSKEGDRTTIANIWELAGDTQLAQLLDVVLTTPKLASAQVVIVADLSKPSEVLNCVRYWLKAVRARVKACSDELRCSEVGQAALRELAARLPPPSVDVELVGIPVVIVGAKYDAFAAASQASTQLLQVMARTLRFVAHTNGASLVFTSEQDKVRTRERARGSEARGRARVARPAAQSVCRRPSP
jgi:dynein light intermediate chain 2